MTQISSPNKEPERRTGVAALFPHTNPEIPPAAWEDWQELINTPAENQEQLNYLIDQFLCLWGKPTVAAIRTEYLKMGFRAGSEKSEPL